MKTKVSVTLSHIRRAVESFEECPLALAIKPHVIRGAKVYVSPCLHKAGHVAVYLSITTIDIKLPRTANRFALQFDAAVKARKGRAHLKPFTFTLDIPREMVRVRA